MEVSDTELCAVVARVAWEIGLLLPELTPCPKGNEEQKRKSDFHSLLTH
jgi:hypothetical protein